MTMTTAALVAAGPPTVQVLKVETVKEVETKTCSLADCVPTAAAVMMTAVAVLAAVAAAKAPMLIPMDAAMEATTLAAATVTTVTAATMAWTAVKASVMVLMAAATETTIVAGRVRVEVGTRSPRTHLPLSD